MHGLRLSCCCLCCRYFKVCNEVSWHSFKAASSSVPRRGLRWSCWTGWPAEPLEEHTSLPRALRQGGAKKASNALLVPGVSPQPCLCPGRRAVGAFQEHVGCPQSSGLPRELGRRHRGAQAEACLQAPHRVRCCPWFVLRPKDLPRHH